MNRVNNDLRDWLDEDNGASLPIAPVTLKRQVRLNPFFLTSFFPLAAGCGRAKWRILEPWQ